jgi:hypothetical protein
MKVVVPFVVASGMALARSDYPVKPMPFTVVHVTDAFWAP